MGSNLGPGGPAPRPASHQVGVGRQQALAAVNERDFLAWVVSKPLARLAVYLADSTL